MRSRPRPLRLAGISLALSSLALLPPGPARADNTAPPFLYQVVGSSANDLRVLAANPTTVLVREKSLAGEELKLCPLNGTAPVVIASAGGPFPGGGMYPESTQFSQATIDKKGFVLYRAFSAMGASAWGVATLFYSIDTQRSVALQPFVTVPQAVKNILDQAFDSNGQLSVRTTALLDGSATFVRVRDDMMNVELGIALQTGDKIVGAKTEGETVMTVGAVRIDSQNNLFVPVESNLGNSYVVHLGWVPNAANRWQQSGAAPFLAGFVFQQVSLDQTNSNQMLVLGKKQGEQNLSLWTDNWKQTNPTAALVSELNGLGPINSISDLRTSGSGEVHAAVTTGASGATMVRDITVIFDPAPSGPKISSVELLFGTNQATPLGPVSEIYNKLAALGNGALVFAGTVPTGNTEAVFAATPFPTAGAVQFKSIAKVVYKSAGGRTFDFPFSGSATLKWVGGVLQLDGSSTLRFTLDRFGMRYREPDATNWGVDEAGPSGGQILVSRDHFGRPTASVNLNLGLTVGQMVFPRVPWSGAGSFDPITGIFTFKAAGPGVLANSIFDSGDEADFDELDFFFE